MLHNLYKQHKIWNVTQKKRRSVDVLFDKDNKDFGNRVPHQQAGLVLESAAAERLVLFLAQDNKEKGQFHSIDSTE